MSSEHLNHFTYKINVITKYFVFSLLVDNCVPTDFWNGAIIMASDADVGDYLP